MGSAKSLIRSLSLVLFSILAYIQADAQILVSGTDFDPLPGNETRFYIGLPDVAQIGFQTGSISSTPPIAPNVNTNNFNAGYFYAITPTPIRLDSTRYQDFVPTDYSYVYSPLTASPNVNILSYSLTGLVPSSAVSVIVDYCSAVKSTYATCTGQRNEFKAGINLDQYNLLNGNDASQISMGQCQTATFNGTVDATGNMVFRMNATQAGSCKAMAIKKIRIMGLPQPKIISTSGNSPCAGEQVTLQSTIQYNGTYQWQVDDGTGFKDVTSGGTNQSLLYELASTAKSYKFQVLVTPPGGGAAIPSNIATITSKVCCEDPITGIGSSRKMIYFDDFGTLDLVADPTGKTYKVWDYTNVLNPVLATKTTTTPFRWQLTPAPLGATFKATGAPNDGEYVVASYLTGYGTTQGSILEWAANVGGLASQPTLSYDHSGAKEGAALFINCPPGTQGQPIYSRTISNLCFGKKLEFECWINVFSSGKAPSCPGNYEGANVTVKLIDGSNPGNTNIPIPTLVTRQDDGGTGWVKVTGEIILGAGSTSVIMQVINNSAASLCGNDLVIDDIKIMACAPPPLTLYFDVPTLLTQEEVCSSPMDLNVKPSTLLNSFYGGNPKFLYQWSRTPAIVTSWTNLAAPQLGQTFAIANPQLNAAYATLVDGDKVYFRAVAASDAIFVAKNNFTGVDYANDNDPCKNYSVSNVIESIVKCPKCQPPTTVTITPATQSLCAGANLTIKGVATFPATPPNGAYRYTWYKGTYSVANIVAGPSATYADYAKTAVVAADGGTYTLRVEDYTAPGGVATCYKEASVVVTVNAVPTISSAAAGSVCSEVAQNYAITSAVASSYAWTRAVVSGITPATIGSGTTASITETLTNTTTAPIVVRYVITPTSTAGSCPGPAFNYDVTVNPKPKITSAITGSVCSGIAQAYTITSDVASSYAWTRAVVTNITPATVGSGSTAAITETLTNTLTPAGPVNVIYKLTPTATTGGCVGTTVDYTVTVNPSPTITSAATGSICSGIAPSYTIASSIPASYAWTRAVVTGITPATAGSGATASIAETLTNTTTAPINVEYKIRGTATTGGCVGPEFTYTLTVNPTPVVAATTASICSGVAQNHAITSVVPSSYAWSRPIVTGITPATAGAGTTTPITETLSNNTTAPIAVVYSITPTSTTGSCVGAASTYTVTVNPKPTITSAPTGTTCTNVALNYLIASDVASTYSWTRAAVTGVSPAPGAASTANPITETLTSSSDVDVVYTITPTSTAGSCPGPAFTYTVRISATAVPTVAITTTPGTTICANTPVTFTTTVTSGGTPTYEWFVNNLSQGAASSAAGSEQFSSSTLTNGAVVKVEITSSLGCAVPKTATESVTMTVNPNVTASVTVAADKTDICPNESVTFTATPVNGGTTPAPTYVWKDKAGAVISGPTGTTYITTGLTAANNSVTVEMTSTANCATPKPAISAAASVTIKPVPVPSVSIAADKMAVCEGNPVEFTATPVDGGLLPKYQWYIGSTPQLNATNATFITSDLKVAPGNTVKVEMISNADCAPTVAAASNVVTIAVSPGVKPGKLSIDQTICYGTAAGKITETEASDAVTATYTWEQSDPLDPTIWGPANGVASNGGKDFTPSDLLTSGISYRRRVDDAAAPAPCDRAFTTPVKITVNLDVTAGVIASSATATCENEEAGEITSTNLPTGGATTPAFEYVWEKMTATDADFVAAPGSNIGTAYNPGILSVTTSYRRKEINNCKTVYSNIIVKTVTPNTPVSITITPPAPQNCAGTAITLTTTSSGGGTPGGYQWFNNNVPVGTNNDSYTFTPAVGADNSNIQIRVELTSSETCNTGKASSTVAVTVVDAVEPKIEIVGTTVNCEGFPSTFRVSSEIGQGNNPRYDWYVGSTLAQSGPDKTFKTSDLLDGEKVYVELISDLPCKIGIGPFLSNEITMQIKPIPSPSINEPGDTICSPATYPLSAQVRLPAYTGTTYQWMRDGKAIAGATTDKYTASESGVYAISEYNGTCNNTSPGKRVVVIQTPVAYAGEDMYIKEGDRGQLFGSGGAIYNWTPSTGLSDPKISNPTFTADQTTLYTLTVSDPTGKCKTPDEVIVYVVRPIKIPNVITINGDGTNDTWEIENIEGYPNAEFLIYNRWGNLVWKQEGNAKKWDGTNFRNGEVLPDGTYFYIITLNSQIYSEPYTGWIQIVK